MSTLLKTSGVGSKDFGCKDLHAGDILFSGNDSVYVVPGIVGNGVIKSDGKFTVLNEDLTNPHSGTAKLLDIVRVVRINSNPDIETVSEAMGYVFLGKPISPKYALTVIWNREDPKVTAAKAALAAAEKARADAIAAADREVARRRSILSAYGK